MRTGSPVVIQWVSGRLACFGGKHYRSERQAFRVEGTDRYESVCTYCGVPMERLAKRHWIVKSRS